METRIPPPDAIVTIEGLRKDYGTAQILRGIDLEVKAGEVLALVGASGSGKTTCLRCINRLESPTAGRIVVAGNEITAPKVNLDMARRNIGMVFQQINLYPHMTALQNVSLALRKVLKLPSKEADARAMRHIEAVDMAQKALSYPEEMSGGQQQRIGIARAMAMEPAVLLLDEPTSALDPELVGEVLSVLHKTRDTGVTMVLVTHEMRFAREMADRVAFMDDGLVIDQGTTEEVLVKPRHERIRSFLKSLRH